MIIQFVALLIAAAATSIPSEQSAVMTDFVDAWDAADAPRIALLFEPDGRLVIPSGMELPGRPAVQQFYAAAFSHGYKGSKGGSTVTRATQFTPDLAMIEGGWTIDGAKKPDGSLREPESGQFATVIRKSGGKWRIVSLREMRLAR
jgi:uncharacterized protein (TIGR02246 family)